MTFDALGTGLSALSAARLALRTIGHNLANATTPGYSRQRVHFQTGLGVSVGGHRIGLGVDVAGIERVTDDLLVGRVRDQLQQVGRRDVLFERFSEVEAVFGEPGPLGLSHSFSGFFDGAGDLLDSADDPSARQAFVNSGVDLAQRLRSVREDLLAASADTGLAIEATTASINRLTESLGEINRQLQPFQLTGAPPGDLLDRQSALLDELAGLVDFETSDLGGGRLGVHVGGHLVVSRQGSRALELDRQDGRTRVTADDAVSDLDVRSGRLGALLELEADGAGAALDRLDELASELIRSVNAIHATGVPAGGGPQSLRAHNAFADRDGDGDLLEERLGQTGLPFPIVEGALRVSVLDEASGQVTTTSLSLEPDSTVQELIDGLDGIAGLGATVDATGRLVVQAAAGHRFHFAAAVDSNPDDGLTFGSDAGLLAGTATGPFALSDGDILSFEVDGGGPQEVTFRTTQFADIGAATAEEVVAVIQSELSGATARIVDGRIVIESDTTGDTSSLAVSESAGSPLDALGLTTTLDVGGGGGVAVGASGTYTGEDATWTFRPVGVGTVGGSPGFSVEVRDGAGALVATLDVGAGYEPGTPIEVADGVSVSFGAGALAEDSGDFFTLDVSAEGDATGLLAATGLGGFFAGHDASSIDVASTIVDDPTRLVTGLLGGAADGSNLQRLLALRDQPLESFQGRSLEGAYASLVSGTGQDAARAGLARDTDAALLESLESRLEQIRGVSIDEELARLQEFERAFQAAARYVTAIDEVNRILFSI